VAGVADEDDRVAAGGEPAGLGVHLRDEGTGRVEHLQVALGAAPVHLRGDAVGGEHQHGAGRDVLLGLDEDGAPAGQLRDHVAVVHDLAADVHGRPEVVEGPLHRVDGTVDSGAVSAG
jgi:hypothetical protein